jgi:hypothetical protein
MTDSEQQDAETHEKSEMRMMWIGTVTIVALIVALMGYNMWAHPDAGNNSSELSSQSRSAPTQ